MSLLCGSFLYFIQLLLLKSFAVSWIFKRKCYFLFYSLLSTRILFLCFFFINNCKKKEKKRERKNEREQVELWVSNSHTKRIRNKNMLDVCFKKDLQITQFFCFLRVFILLQSSRLMCLYFHYKKGWCHQNYVIT